MSPYTTPKAVSVNGKSLFVVSRECVVADGSAETDVTAIGRCHYWSKHWTATPRPPLYL
jgi:hypothetical protein